MDKSRYTIYVPKSYLSRADDLIKSVERHTEALLFTDRVRRCTVMRMAIERGLDVLEKELKVDS